MRLHAIEFLRLIRRHRDWRSGKVGRPRTGQIGRLKQFSIARPAQDEVGSAPFVGEGNVVKDARGGAVKRGDLIRRERLLIHRHVGNAAVQEAGAGLEAANPQAG